MTNKYLIIDKIDCQTFFVLQVLFPNYRSTIHNDNTPLQYLDNP